MQLKPEQLNAHLIKNSLPVYFAFGDADLLVQESVATLKAHKKPLGFTTWEVFEVKNKQFDWAKIKNFLQMGSLFSPQKAIEIRLKETEIGATGSKALRDILELLDNDTHFIISAGYLRPTTQKTAWFQEINKKGAVIMHWPVPPMQLPYWISQRAKAMNLNLSTAHCQLLAQHCEGNLLAAKQELDKFALLDNPEKLESYFIQSSQYSVFSLTDTILEGNPTQSLKILNTLQETNTPPSLCLWAFTKLLREWSELLIAQTQGTPLPRLMTSFGLGKKRQSLYQNALPRFSLQKLYTFLQTCDTIDKYIKTGQTQLAWQGFTDLLIILTS